MGSVPKGPPGDTRRRFLLKLIGLMAGGWAGVRLLRQAPRAGAEETPRIVLPQGTDPRTLTGRNPADLDTRHLEVMPLEDFKTMGLSNHRIDRGEWRLAVEGAVQTPLALAYGEITLLPAVEKNVLLICPGFFCNHGRWRGVSIRALLASSGAHPGATHVTVQGPLGPYRKTHRLTLDALAGDRAFLAYAVNGEVLPIQHGFPLRLVSADDYGYDWVKYVQRITVETIGA